MEFYLILDAEQLARLDSWLSCKENVWASYFPTAPNAECEGHGHKTLITKKHPEPWHTKFKVELEAPWGQRVRLTEDGRLMAMDNGSWAAADMTALDLPLPPHLRWDKEHGRKDIMLMNPAVFLAKMFDALNGPG